MGLEDLAHARRVEQPVGRLAHLSARKAHARRVHEYGGLAQVGDEKAAAVLQAAFGAGAGAGQPRRAAGAGADGVDRAVGRARSPRGEKPAAPAAVPKRDQRVAGLQAGRALLGYDKLNRSVYLRDLLVYNTCLGKLGSKKFQARRKLGLALVC